MKKINFNFTKVILLLSCFSIFACSPSDTTTFESSDCNPCKMFVTATATQGNFGSASVADLICTNDANKPNDGDTYKALIAYGNGSRRACTTANCVTGGKNENVDWVLHASTSYTRADGTAIATTDGAGIITSFPIANAVSTTASIEAWTGFTNATAWTSAATDNCTNWTSTSSSNPPGGNTAIVNGTTSYGSVFAFAYTCNQTKRLICVQQ
ncbi:hypothetical protein CIK05_11910 [Bdellovibrio sp. qaytius]|nr:hypothetical protein CIK05_11910 [Bdellovibrio sp. qaytius]